ncbi:SDR family oxidoreductase [Candidatus Pacearchaeota archaeon]|nr:SDR family oxidoreductase [Candidatus Pacearchaeota archaeon]
MNILITGSHGLIGRIISEELKKEHNVTCLDKKVGIDLLANSLGTYFKNIDTVIHLAANANPFINRQEALKNIEIANAVIRACKGYKTKRIINASSINVYPYIDLFEQGQKLTRETPLSPNLRFGNGNYGKAKIEVERLFEAYCEPKKISLLNLRIGCVTPYNLPSRQQDGHVEPADYEIHLKHEDLISIIKRSLQYKGINSYVCVSKRNGFVEDSIRFPID